MFCTLGLNSKHVVIHVFNESTQNYFKKQNKITCLDRSDRFTAPIQPSYVLINSFAIVGGVIKAYTSFGVVTIELFCSQIVRFLTIEYIGLSTAFYL